MVVDGVVVKDWTQAKSLGLLCLRVEECSNSLLDHRNPSGVVVLNSNNNLNQQVVVLPNLGPVHVRALVLKHRVADKAVHLRVVSGETGAVNRLRVNRLRVNPQHSSLTKHRHCHQIMVDLPRLRDMADLNKWPSLSRSWHQR